VPYLIDSEFRYRVHNSPPLVAVLREISSCPAVYFLTSILLPSCHLFLCLPSCISPSRLPTKTLYACILCPILATCPTLIILLYSGNQIWYGLKTMKPLIM